MPQRLAEQGLTRFLRSHFVWASPCIGYSVHCCYWGCAQPRDAHCLNRTTNSSLPSDVVKKSEESPENAPRRSSPRLKKPLLQESAADQNLMASRLDGLPAEISDGEPSHQNHLRHAGHSLDRSSDDSAPPHTHQERFNSWCDGRDVAAWRHGGTKFVFLVVARAIAVSATLAESNAHQIFPSHGRKTQSSLLP